MTKRLFNLAFILLASSTSVLAQCEYNAQIPIDMGPGSTADTPAEILIQEDGKVIGVSSTYYISSNHFEASLFRLNTDNTFDQTFGVNGRVGHTWDQRNTVNCAILSEDESILIGGYQAPSNGVSGIRGYLGKVLNDGTPDLNFGDNGSYKFSLIPGMESHVVGIKEEPSYGPVKTHALVPNEGDLTAAFISREPSGFGVFRLTHEGVLDSSFATNGYVSHTVPDVTWQANYGEAHFQYNYGIIIVGKVLMGTSAHPFVARMLGDGTLDEDFGESGILRLTDEVGYSFTDVSATLDQEDNVLLTYATTGSPTQYVITKVNGITGQVDTSFGENGRRLATASGSFNIPWDIVCDPWNELIYVLGEGSSSNRFPTIWTVDLNGNEVALCNGESTYINPLEQSQGYHAGRIDENGELKILGDTGLNDSTSGDNQSLNMMIPTIALPSSLSEYDALTFDLFPNPSTGQLTLPLAMDQPLTYRILDVQGRLVQEGMSNGQIDVSALNQGYYHLLATSKDGQQGRQSFLRE